MKFDILQTNFVKIEDDIILSDNRILIFYLYKLISRCENCCYTRSELFVDGIRVMLRSCDQKVNFFPSFQKGHGRYETKDGLDWLKDQVDMFIIVEAVEGGVILHPVLPSQVTKAIMSKEELCL